MPKTPRILSLTDNVVDCYQAEGLMFPGGNCLNLSVFCARFGAESLYCGAVAADAAGAAIRAALRAEGVDQSLLQTRPGQTAYCLIETRDGERHFAGANLGVSIIAPPAEALAALAPLDAVHTGRSSHLQHWLPRLARTRLSYDFATRHDADQIAAIAPLCYLASFSGGDLTRAAALALAAQAQAAGAEWVLVTRGAAGALLLGAPGLFEVAAAEVVPVDTLGAGDTFIARCLVGLLRDEPPADLLAAAAEEAARTCTGFGAFGHGVPIEVDARTAMGIDEIYRTIVPPAAE